MEGDGDDADEESEYWVIFACQIVLGSSKTHSHSRSDVLTATTIWTTSERNLPPIFTQINASSTSSLLSQPTSFHPTITMSPPATDLPTLSPTRPPAPKYPSPQIPTFPNTEVNVNINIRPHPHHSSHQLSPLTHQLRASKQASEPSFSSTGLTVPGDVNSVSH